MATFPQLSSGAVTQYPTTLLNEQAVQVIRFLDGADQRCLARGKALRRWAIRLDILNESEIQQVENFFSLQQGEFELFSFPDPFTGGIVPNCRLGSSSFVADLVSTDIATSSLWVIESNG